MIYGYFGVRDTLRQGEAALLSVTPDIAKGMPPEVLRLIGYYRSQANMGGLRGKDPIDTYPPMTGYSERWAEAAA